MKSHSDDANDSVFPGDGQAVKAPCGSALPRLVTPSWLLVAIGVSITAPLTLYWWNLITAGSITFDWDVYLEASRRALAGSPDLYEQNAEYGFRHSPVFAYLVSLFAWLGTTGIRLVTLAAALALPTWPMRLLALASWPFAMDLQHGALLTIIVCVAAWALRGSRVGGISFVIIALLSPRVLMFPILAYLLWKQQWLRVPAVALAVVHALVVVASGYADDWIGALLAVGTDQVGTLLNLSPSRFLGAWWLVAGVPLGIWLTVRGHPGFAALAMSPYVLPHYLLLLLLELPDRIKTSDVGERTAPGEAARA